MLKKRYNLIFALIFSIILLTVSSASAQIVWKNEPKKLIDTGWGSQYQNVYISNHYPPLENFILGEDYWWLAQTNATTDGSSMYCGYQFPTLRTYKADYTLLTMNSFANLCPTWGGTNQWHGLKFCSIRPNTTNTTDKIWFECSAIDSYYNAFTYIWECYTQTDVGWINGTTKTSMGCSNGTSFQTPQLYPAINNKWWHYNQSSYQLSNFGWASSNGAQYEPYGILFWNQSRRDFVLWAGDTTNNLLSRKYANTTADTNLIYEAVPYQDTGSTSNWDIFGHQTGGAWNYIIYIGNVTGYPKSLWVNKYTFGFRKQGVFGTESNIKDRVQLYSVTTSDIDMSDVTLAKKNDGLTGWILMKETMTGTHPMYDTRNRLRLIYTDDAWRAIDSYIIHPDLYYSYNFSYGYNNKLNFTQTGLVIPTSTIRIHPFAVVTGSPSTPQYMPFNISISNGTSYTEWTVSAPCVYGCISGNIRVWYIEKSNPYPNQTVTVTVNTTGGGALKGITYGGVKITHFWNFDSPVLSVNKEFNTFVISFLGSITGSYGCTQTPCDYNGTDQWNTSAWVNDYVWEETIPCSTSAWTPDANCYYNNTRRYTRYVTPAGCDNDTKYEYDPNCAGGGCTPHYQCYNSTELGYYNSSCGWSYLLYCTYGCNSTGNPPHSCYGSPICSQYCQNPEMHQNPFPDCSCSCTNYCLEYLNLSQSCACSPYPALNYSQLQINTSEWQRNPVTIFADITSGIFALVGNILVPLMIIFLAIGFATIIVIIFKKAVPSGV